MKISSIRTNKLIPDKSGNIFDVLDQFIQAFSDKTILVVTSKIVAICEGSVVPMEGTDKKKLIRQEAEKYLPPSKSKYDITLTIRNSLLLPSAGIDESNGSGYYILWPSDSQNSANAIREYLVKRFKVNNIGVLITDSTTTTLRWGTLGTTVAHSGFLGLNDYIGKPDIFGKLLKMTKVNVRDALSTASVVLMGESNEQTPLAIIEDVPFVEFQDRNPTKEELADLVISMEDDIYAPIINSVDWLTEDK